VARIGAVALLLLVVAVGLIATYLVRASDPTTVAERAGRNAELIATAEATVGLDPLSGVVEALGRGPLAPLVALVYGIGYWPFLIVAFVVTLRRHQATFHRLWLAVAGSGLVGLAVMAVLPVAPPRLLGGADVVAEHGLGRLAHPPGLVNPHAAMPSFHVGWSLIAALALGAAVPRMGRWMWLHPTVMAVAVVATANHYLLDVVAGAALGAGAWTATGRGRGAGWVATLAVGSAPIDGVAERDQIPTAEEPGALDRCVQQRGKVSVTSGSRRSPTPPSRNRPTPSSR
jgi:hypothetical protein